jgi:hypothetical protein
LSAAAGGRAVASGDPARAAEAHRTLLEDESIQFEMKEFVPPEPPAWLRWLAELLADTGPFWVVLFWVAAAAVLLTLLYFAARWIERGGLGFLKPRSEGESQAPDNWTIAEAPARALLAEADALAGAGRFSQAAHLLLFRTIEEIDRRRPDLVRPALTSRDIGGAPQLPPGPRSAFQRIAMAVERSLFGGRSLALADWQSCRAAYEDFVVAREWSR